MSGDLDFTDPCPNGRCGQQTENAPTQPQPTNFFPGTAGSALNSDPAPTGAPDSGTIAVIQPWTSMSAGTQQTQTEPSRAHGTLAVSTSAVSNPSLVSSSSTGSSSGTKLSNGAVAGIAIAALIVGAGIAFLASFFLFKKRSKNRNVHGEYTSYTDSTPELVMVQKGGSRNSPYVQVSQTPLPAPSPAPAPVQKSQPNDVIASILPPAAQEQDVRNRAAMLFSQIHRHVETYYRDVHASLTPSMEPELAGFGADSVNMAELLQDCSSPTVAIKHALVAYVLNITGPRKANGQDTIFPDELQAARLQDNPPSDPNLTTASTIHRRLSVYLFTNSNATSSSPTSPSSSSPARLSRAFHSEIREAAEHFSLTFFPWANPTGDDEAKDEDLSRIIAEALEMRIWLFGQPCLYVFRWDGVGMRGVGISPEVVMSEDEQVGGKVVLESRVMGM